MSLFKKKLKIDQQTRALLFVTCRDGQWGLELGVGGEFIRCHTRPGAVEAARMIGRWVELHGGLAELVIFNAHGKIVAKDSYGKDPRDIEG